MLDLEQAGEDVTGMWTDPGGTYPLEGTLDGTDREFGNGSSSPVFFTAEATVSGDLITGTLVTGADTFAFTATRVPAP